MNILIINHYAGSQNHGMVYRPYYMGREFVKKGHTVTIAAASFSHLRLNNPVVGDDLQQECIDGIRYIWLKTPRYHKTGVGRVLNMLTFVGKLWLYERRIGKLSLPDVVIASSTYNLEIYSAHRIAKRHQAKLYYEVRDLWPLTPMLIGGYSACHPFIWAVQKAEDYACRKSDGVISLLWNSESYLRNRGLSEGRFTCIPNGFSPVEWTNDSFQREIPSMHEKLFREYADKTIVGFAGGFAPSGSVDTLVKAAVLLTHRQDIHFVLVGKGPEQAKYECIIEENGLTNVSILPSVPKSLIPAVNRRFDIAFLGGLHSELHKYGTSYNKMTDYMLSGTPIVQAVDEPGSIIERIGCGIRVEAENAKAVSEAITIFSNMTGEERKNVGERGRIYCREHLSWDILAEVYLSVVAR